MNNKLVLSVPILFAVLIILTGKVYAHYNASNYCAPVYDVACPTDTPVPPVDTPMPPDQAATPPVPTMPLPPAEITEYPTNTPEATVTPKSTELPTIYPTTTAMVYPLPSPQPYIQPEKGQSEKIDTVLPETGLFDKYPVQKIIISLAVLVSIMWIARLARRR